MKDLEFKKFILKEINSICKEEKINLQLKSSYNSFSEDEQISKEVFEEDAKELKSLTEEISRMKELLNFKSPLLEK
jgi:hypothetical protein